MLEEENLKSDFFKDLNSKTCNDKISKLLYSNAHTNIHNTTKHIIIQNNMCVCVCVCIIQSKITKVKFIK